MINYRTVQEKKISVTLYISVFLFIYVSNAILFLSSTKSSILSYLLDLILTELIWAK